MLPSSYQLPTAVVFIVVGLVACFAGNRLFRFVLGLYGFIIGALLGSSFVAASNQAGMLIAAAVGGVLGALAFFAAYFVGVVLVGAGLGALVSHIVWSGLGREPGLLIVVGFAAVGGAIAWFAQRIVVVLATAVAGSWTALMGTMMLLGSQLARQLPRNTGDVWIEYPTSVPAGQRWVILAWVVLAALGVAAQLGQKGGPSKAKRK